MRNAGKLTHGVMDHAPEFAPPALSARAKPTVSFRAVFLLLFVGSLVLSLVMTGLLTFRLQRAFLLDQAQSRLIGFIQADVEQYAGGPELTGLAVDLAQDLQVLGAELFIQNARGELVQPVLGAQSRLSPAEHQTVRANLQSKMQLTGSGSSARLVYLTPVVDSTGAVLGSIESSLPVAAISQPLGALRREISWIVMLVAGLGTLAAGILSKIVTRPVQRMLAAIEDYNDGDLQARAPLSNVAEMHRLAMAYNRLLDWMSEDIRNQIRRAEDAPSASRD